MVKFEVEKDMENVELEISDGDKQKDEVVKVAHHVQALMCPEPGCKTFFSSMSSFCAHVAKDHNMPLYEFRTTFPSFEDYRMWLDHMTTSGAMEFLKPRPEQLQADGTLVGFLYCSQIEKKKSMKRSARHESEIDMDGNCIAHIRCQLNPDSQVEVYAQMSHIGHDLKQVPTPLGYRREVVKELEEVNTAFSGLSEFLDQTFVSPTIDLKQIPKLGIALKMIVDAGNGLKRAKIIAEEIHNMFKKTPEANRFNIQPVRANQARVGYAMQMTNQVVPAINQGMVIKKRRIEGSLSQTVNQNPMVKNESNFFDFDEPADLMPGELDESNRSTSTGYEANSSSQLSSIQQTPNPAPEDQMVATHCADGRIQCPRCHAYLKNIATFKAHSLNVHNIRLVLKSRAQTQNFVSQQQRTKGAAGVVTEKRNDASQYVKDVSAAATDNAASADQYVNIGQVVKDEVDDATEKDKEIGRSAQDAAPYAGEKVCDAEDAAVDLGKSAGGNILESDQVVVDKIKEAGHVAHDAVGDQLGESKDVANDLSAIADEKFYVLHVGKAE